MGMIMEVLKDENVPHCTQQTQDESSHWMLKEQTGVNPSGVLQTAKGTEKES